MSRLKKVTVIAFAASLVLAGCSDSSESEPGVAPEAGQTITGTGYTFVAPEGWAQLESSTATEGADTVVADQTDTDGFANNANVVLSPAGQVTPEQVETLGAGELEKAGATDVMVRDRVAVAGSKAAHLSARFTSEGTAYQVEQFYVTGDGQTFVLTFSFSPAVSDADRDALTDSMLATWSRS